MSTQEKTLTLESLESALQAGQTLPQIAPSAPARIVPVVKLPKKGMLVTLSNKPEKPLTIHETEFDKDDAEEFVIIHPFKNKNALGIPTKAFYQVYESIEIVDGEKTGKKFVYTPDKKSQSIFVEVINKDGKNLRPFTYTFSSPAEKVAEGKTLSNNIQTSNEAVTPMNGKKPSAKKKDKQSFIQC